MKNNCSRMDVLCILAGKVIKKVGMGCQAATLLTHVTHKRTKMDSRYAEQILNEAMPKPKGKVHVERPCAWNKNPKYDLQIIIPAYNVEKYVEECIDSVLSQQCNFKWQAIIVDDGSTDCTLEIIKQFENDPHVCIISQKNAGFSGARNTGLTLLSTKYVAFLDSDDKLEKGAIHKLLAPAIEYNLDIVEGNYYNWREEKLESVKIHKTEMENLALNALSGFAWMKVIRGDLFSNLQFPEGYWFEDSIMAFLLFPLCEKCATIEDMVYYYRRRAGGISYSSKGKPKSIDTYYIAELMLQTATEMQLDVSQLYPLMLSHVLLSYRNTR